MNDLRLAIRTLSATPIVSVVAILSLALGIGANTAIFSVVDTLLLRSLPVKDPEQLVQLEEASADGQRNWTYPIWDQIDQRPQLFDRAFAWSNTRFNLAAGGETEFVDGIWASAGMFDTLGVPPVLGRTFNHADDRRGGGPDGPVAVISYDFWQRRFGGATDAIGGTLNVERVPVTVIGVTPPGFFGPDVGRTFDIVLPLGVEPLVRGRETWLDGRSTWWLSVIARLKPNQSREAAIQALQNAQPQIREATHPGWADYLKDPLTLVPAANGDSALRRRYHRAATILMGIVGLVLLIAASNIANLLLARATARRHELSVRLALGASRGQLIRLLLTESVVLATIGAGLGILLARSTGQVLVAQMSTPNSRVFLDLSLDWRVLGFAIAATAVSVLLFGTAPALRGADVRPMEAIKEHGRSASSHGHARMSSTLVIAQVALSVILVAAAGLFVRTFATLANLPLGFQPAQVLVVTVNAQRTQVAPSDRLALFERARHAVASVPGVGGASLSIVTPVTGQGWNGTVEVSDVPPLPGRQSMTFKNAVTPDWFRTLGTPLIVGRHFTDSDGTGAPRVAIVNQTFVRKFMNGASPIGHTVRDRGVPGLANNDVPKEIVGVVADAVYRNLREPIPATLYVPMAQLSESFAVPAISLSVRSTNAGSPALLSHSVATAIADVNSALAVTFLPMTSLVNASLTQERVIATLSGFFGGLALLLAGLGLYGVTAYAVSRRRSEIGIRMALGAPPSGVVRLVFARVARLVGAGVIAGILVSLWLSRFVESLLFGMTSRDPMTLAAAALVLTIVGAVAGWIPARRASRIDPGRVLRDA
jgi:putative ABC transport system permease protein